MTTTTTARFSSAFDPAQSSHVLWLSEFFKYAENLATSSKDIGNFINTNPMNIHLKREEMLDWVQIHFSLAMKYSQYVLRGKAYIPPTVTADR